MYILQTKRILDRRQGTEEINGLWPIRTQNKESMHGSCDVAVVQPFVRKMA